MRPGRPDRFIVASGGDLGHAVTPPGGPYADRAGLYWDAGWRGVLPLPPRQKASPPPGWTGRDGAWPSRADVETWRSGPDASGNLALRLPVFVLGIDVDNYDRKLGRETIEAAIERFGPLPPTWRSTSRDDGVSGIMLFRVPEGLHWPGVLGAGVELITWYHRYALAWPSIHPEGRQYRWITPHGVPVAVAEVPPVGLVPVAADLPELPEAWVLGLTGGDADVGRTRAALTDSEVATWVSAHGAGEPCPAVRDAVDAGLRRFGGSTSRHDAARDATARVTMLAGEGHPGATAALRRIGNAFRAALEDTPGRDYDPAEWGRLIGGAVRLAAGAEVPGRDPCAVRVLPVVEDGDERDETFWSARPELTLIHRTARATMCSPWALFGAVAARLITAVPRLWVLPATVGSQASLNLFVALVGPSGSGKGTAMSVAEELLDVGHVHVASVGSGEGLAHLFVRRDKHELVEVNEAVLLDVAEVDTLKALTVRQGATLGPELRKASMGERLGFNYVDPAKRLSVARHGYRLSMVVGVQPERAGTLLDDADGGTPQRFLWLPTTDPDVPEQDTPRPVERLTWKRHDLGVGQAPVAGRREMTLPDVAIQAVKVARRASLRGVAHPLDGHALLMREKVAATLALLANRTTISDEDWSLAGTVMAVSDATRAGVVAKLTEQSAATNRNRGRADAERAVMVADAQEDRQVSRVAHRLGVRLAKAGAEWTTKGDLYRGTAYDDRKVFPEAVEALVNAGQIEVDESDRERPRYRAKDAEI